MIEEVRNAIDRLKAQGEHYVTSADIIEELDEPNTSGKRGWVGRLMNQLTQEREDIEQWNSGSKCKRWRVK